jgi:hypothetical protein
VDFRRLTVSLTGFTLDGPSGDPAVCRRVPPDPPER